MVQEGTPGVHLQVHVEQETLTDQLRSNLGEHPLPKISSLLSQQYQQVVGGGRNVLEQQMTKSTG